MNKVGHGVDYSVWNDHTLAYDYYRAPKKLRAGVIAPMPRIRSTTALGATPGAAARRLPGGAVRIGSGPFAKGVIAARNGDATALSGLGEVSEGTRTLVGIAVALLVYRWAK
jgi:hypothetical protein